MPIWRSWQLGEPDSLIYSLYDRMRRALNHTLVRFLMNTIKDNQGACVLEAGSGPAYASFLFARNPSVRLSVAIDIDPVALLEAHKGDAQLALVVADLHNLPFQDTLFDLVWNSSTMEHLDNPAPVLQEFARLLKSDGYLFIGVPYRYGPLGIQRWISNTQVGIWIGSVFDKNQLSGWMQTGGFVVQKFTHYFFHFFIGVLAKRR